MKTDDGLRVIRQVVSELKIDTAKARSALYHSNIENRIYGRLAKRLDSVEKLAASLEESVQQMCKATRQQLNERAIVEGQLRHLAYYDDLTGLPNRVMLRDRLEQVIAQAERHTTGFALLFLDLDGFKTVNDMQGHVIGNKLLQAVAERLTASVRVGDTVCRYGGDEFILVLVDVANAPQAAHIAENVLAMVATPYLIEGQKLMLTASTGIALYPSHGQSIGALIRCADVAMLRSKTSGRNQYQFAME